MFGIALALLCGGCGFLGDVASSPITSAAMAVATEGQEEHEIVVLSESREEIDETQSLEVNGVTIESTNHGNERRVGQAREIASLDHDCPLDSVGFRRVWTSNNRRADEVFYGIGAQGVIVSDSYEIFELRVCGSRKFYQALGTFLRPEYWDVTGRVAQLTDHSEPAGEEESSPPSSE
ncbi:MAG: hypothetical protein KC561_07575 [Myxococcales bacterium]|nr:hypothetical protein [Myxococcales bacterium]